MFKNYNIIKLKIYNKYYFMKEILLLVFVKVVISTVPREGFPTGEQMKKCLEINQCAMDKFSSKIKNKLLIL